MIYQFQFEKPVFDLIIAGLKKLPFEVTADLIAAMARSAQDQEVERKMQEAKARAQTVTDEIPIPDDRPSK